MAKLNWHPPDIQARTATYHWAVDYAADVHEGEIITNPNGTITILPARRWTDYVVQMSPAAELFVKHYNGSLSQAFDDMAGELNQKFTEAIEAEIWDWPRATIRSTGEVADSPRNIVDTGALKDSQTLTLS